MSFSLPCQSTLHPFRCHLSWTIPQIWIISLLLIKEPRTFKRNINYYFFQSLNYCHKIKRYYILHVLAIFTYLVCDPSFYILVAIFTFIPGVWSLILHSSSNFHIHTWCVIPHTTCSSNFHIHTWCVIPHTTCSSNFHIHTLCVIPHTTF